jgi:hypothetical protein
MQVMQHGWEVPGAQQVQAKKMVAKFKNLRRVLRLWHSQLPNMVKTIQNNKLVLLFLDILEEFRDISLQEWNFKGLVQQHIEHLL